MAVQFSLPGLGENIKGGDVLKVLVGRGDTLRKDQPVLELETDKATVEVPSSVAGTVTDVHVRKGEKIKVGQAILTLEPAESKAQSPKSEVSSPPSPLPVAPPERPAAPAPAPKATPAPRPAAPPAADGDRPPAFAAPHVRIFARELGVDVHDVAGSGPGGRISLDDVKAHAREVIASGAGSAAAPAPPPLPDFTKFGAVERKPLDAIRRVAAGRLAWSWTTVPHVTQYDTADVAALEALRLRLQKKVEAAGGKATVTALLVKIAAAALKAWPKFNSSLDAAAGEVVYKTYVNIGVAVDTEHGLLVPVVRDADRKNLAGVAAELAKLAEKARAKRLSLDDMQGGCFTISNLGGLGGKHFAPIINPPEVAILGVGRAAPAPAVRDGRIEPRSLLPLALSYDHRVIDGADGTRFLRWLVEAIEQPDKTGMGI